MKQYTVRLEDDTVGTIREDTIDFQPMSAFIGEVVNVHLHDENGNVSEKRGKLAEILDVNENA